MNKHICAHFGYGRKEWIKIGFIWREEKKIWGKQKTDKPIKQQNGVSQVQTSNSFEAQKKLIKTKITN